MEKKTRSLRILLLSGAALVILALLAAVLLLSHPKKERQIVPLLYVGEEAGTDVLRAGSRWSGYLTISKHRGEGSLSDGILPIRGLIGTADGQTFFELYTEDDPDGTAPILSLWVQLRGDTMEPVIGLHDARYFDIWLDERDVPLFTLRSENGVLSHSYDYNDGTEKCRIEFQIKAENNT